MPDRTQTIVDLEKKFWQSMVDQEAEVAIGLLAEPALMVSEHGAMRFDHEGYRKMAEQGSMIVKDFEMADVEVTFANDDTAILTYSVKQTVATRDKGERTTQQMNDSSTWVRSGGEWKCVMHTESPATGKQH